MARIVLDGKLLKWGNSYGVRIAKADVERAGLNVGDHLSVTSGPPGRVDISQVPTFDLGGIGKDHDAILHAGRVAKRKRSRSD